MKNQILRLFLALLFGVMVAVAVAGCTHSDHPTSGDHPTKTGEAEKADHPAKTDEPAKDDHPTGKPDHPK